MVSYFQAPSLRVRLLVFFLFPAALLLSLWLASVQKQTQHLLEDQLGRSLTQVAGVFSTTLSVERLTAMQASDAEGEGSRTYRNFRRQFSESAAAGNLRRLWAFNRQGRMLFDSLQQVPLGSDAADISRDRLELEEVWKGTPSQSQVLFTGTDGSYYKTGYAPLWQNSQVVAILAADGSASFFEPLRRLSQQTMWAIAVMMTLWALAALWLATSISRPVERLVQSALRMGRGDLQTPIEKENTPEVGILAHGMEEMRRSLLQRDTTLKLMLSGVAHEVKNPLGGMSLFSGLLEEELLSPTPNLEESIKHTRRLRSETEHLSHIVDDFLRFARDEKYHKQPLQAQEWLGRLKQAWEPEAQNKNINLVLHAEPSELNADVELLSSAVGNLLKNAIQVAPLSSTVELKGRVVDTESYELSVTDAGPGIASETKEKIFDPFFTTKAQGSGLGLALAKKFFAGHGGDLSVESVPGRTVFTATVSRTTAGAR